MPKTMKRSRTRPGTTKQRATKADGAPKQSGREFDVGHIIEKLEGCGQLEMKLDRCHILFDMTAEEFDDFLERYPIAKQRYEKGLVTRQSVLRQRALAIATGQTRENSTPMVMFLLKEDSTFGRNAPDTPFEAGQRILATLMKEINERGRESEAARLRALGHDPATMLPLDLEKKEKS